MTKPLFENLKKIEVEFFSKSNHNNKKVNNKIQSRVKNKLYIYINKTKLFSLVLKKVCNHNKKISGQLAKSKSISIYKIYRPRIIVVI